MKKILILLTLILFTGSAYAGSCPMMAKKLDSKIEEASKNARCWHESSRSWRPCKV